MPGAPPSVAHSVELTSHHACAAVGGTFSQLLCHASQTPGAVFKQPTSASERAEARSFAPNSGASLKKTCGEAYMNLCKPNAWLQALVHLKERSVSCEPGRSLEGLYRSVCSPDHQHACWVRAPTNEQRTTASSRRGQAAQVIHHL